MDRKNELEKYIMEYRAERINLKKKNMTELKTNLQPVFCEKIVLLIEDQLQKNRDLIGHTEVLYLCRLLSSGYTESYESILGLSDKLLFLDKDRSETYWCPKFVYQDMESDMKVVEKRLRKEFVRIEEYELLHLKQLLLTDDWELLQDCFQELAREQLLLITDSGLNFNSEIKVMCGYYMEQLQIKLNLDIQQKSNGEVTII